MTDLLSLDEYKKIASDLPLPTKCFIGGEKVAARSGRTFETVNPADGAVLARLPACAAEDVDAAVASARAAFEDGRWSKLHPADRKAAYNTALWGNADRSKMAGGKLGGCIGEAQKQVYGSPEQIKAKSDAAADQARISRQNLNGDQQLAKLAQEYATCLRGKGYPVTATSVTEIRTALQFVWFGKAAQMAPAPAPMASQSARAD